ncbi:hypothetical protein SUGI_1185140 [Cryptomeria japonica]|nr:hypothetical protein SUGI_1185140 [Cryptomeria japonica]
MTVFWKSFSRQFNCEGGQYRKIIVEAFGFGYIDLWQKCYTGSKNVNSPAFTINIELIGWRCLLWTE